MERKKVLIADDDPSIVHGLKFILSEDGYEVIVAMDGKEALQKAEKETPALMILDIMMPPGGDNEGIEVLRSIRNNPATKEIPVLMLTVKGQDQDINLATNAGANEYITKPFKTDRLIETVRQLTRSSD
jgi:DNA-binding response OmpR family regulator